MIQEILTAITVSGAFLYTFYSIWKSFARDREDSCGGGGCPSCDAKNSLLRDLKGDQKQKHSGFQSFKPMR